MVFRRLNFPREFSIINIQGSICPWVDALRFKFKLRNVWTLKLCNSFFEIFYLNFLSVSGDNIDSMSEEELADIIIKVSVIYRSSPKHKMRVVKVRVGNLVWGEEPLGP